ncbi:MAG: hypothetical protein H7A38_01275 [Chlamydiales bacterium]|nr:hypothetical protein [Chlamydiales bacterium]
MPQNLVEMAKKEEMNHIIVEAVIQKEGKILLIEPLGNGETFYRFPYAEMLEGETMQQALQKAITLQTAMELKEVKRYLGHYDKKGTRHLHFVVEVKDPYSVEEKTSIAFAWVEARDGVGYPITDELREMLDLYVKT